MLNFLIKLFSDPIGKLTKRKAQLDKILEDTTPTVVETTHKEVEYDEEKKVFYVDIAATEEVAPVKKTRAVKPAAPKGKPKAKPTPAAKARANARSKAKTKTTKSASMKTYEGTYNNPSDDFATIAVMSSYSSSSDDYSSRPSDTSYSSNDSFSSGGGDFGGGGSSGSFD